MFKKVIIICAIFFNTCITAQQLRVDSLNLKKFILFCDSTKADEVLISHNNVILTNWINTNCDSLFMGTASMIKSWTGLLVGILIDQNIIGGVNDLVCKYLPEWQDGCTHQVTIKHLLTMSSGLNKKGASGILSKGDMNAYALKLKLDTLPNIRFSYSNESVHLLGLIIQRATGKKAEDVFYSYLFNPLKITKTSLAKDSSGNDIVFGGCRTTTEAALKIGLLMLNNGKYNGKQIVSKEWVQQSTSSSTLAPYYGYLWWIDKNSKHWNYAATGDLGQLTVVFPELNLVLVRRQNCDLSKQSINMSWMGPKFLKLLSDIVQ